jgi:hypothetical protein
MLFRLSGDPQDVPTHTKIAGDPVNERDAAPPLQKSRNLHKDWIIGASGVIQCRIYVRNGAHFHAGLWLCSCKHGRSKRLPTAAPIRSGQCPGLG